MPSEMAVEYVELLRQTRIAYRQNDLQRAFKLAAESTARFPAAKQAWQMRAQIANALGNCEDAIKSIDLALQIEPDDASSLAFRASCLLKIGNSPMALSSATKALEQGLKETDVLTSIGNVFSSLQHHEKALECFEKAVSIDPSDGICLYNLAAVLRFVGELERSEQYFDKAIEAYPEAYEGFYVRSSLRKQTPKNNHINELKRYLDKDWNDWRAEVHICYALGKEYEDLEKWDKSFHFFKRGANLKRKHTKYDANVDVNKMSSIMNSFDEAALSIDHTSCDSEAPIFVLGLPRAGSTLVDRILNAHSQVQSAGEWGAFGQELVRLAELNTNSKKLAFENILAQSLLIDYRTLGENYIKSVLSSSGIRSRFIDKLPFNFLYIGLIHLSLPNSKIIHIHRNPMDACFSIYKAVFKSAYPFSSNLDDLGRYYVSYRKLMNHWNELLPNRILNVSYEDLVSNTSETTREILRYCELGWEDDCLRFYETKEAVSTASAAQVRQPIYSSAVDNWKNYKQYLTELQRFLTDEGLLSS